MFCKKIKYNRSLTEASFILLSKWFIKSLFGSVMDGQWIPWFLHSKIRDNARATKWSFLQSKYWLYVKWVWNLTYKFSTKKWGNFPFPWIFFFQINNPLLLTSNIFFQIGVINLKLHQRKEELCYNVVFLSIILN